MADRFTLSITEPDLVYHKGFYRMEKDEVVRWQRKMRDSQDVWCLRNGEVRARGLKRDRRATFHFLHSAS